MSSGQQLVQFSHITNTILVFFRYLSWKSDLNLIYRDLFFKLSITKRNLWNLNGSSGQIYDWCFETKINGPGGLVGYSYNSSREFLNTVTSYDLKRHLELICRLRKLNQIFKSYANRRSLFGLFNFSACDTRGLQSRARR